jgi:hypothetical protein
MESRFESILRRLREGELEIARKIFRWFEVHVEEGDELKRDVVLDMGVRASEERQRERERETERDRERGREVEKRKKERRRERRGRQLARKRS